MECPVCEQHVPADEFLLHAMYQHPQFFVVWASFSMPTFIPSLTSFVDDDSADIDDMSYEELLQLCDSIGYHTIGVNDIEKVTQTCVKTSLDNDWTCPICLEPSCEDDVYRKITKCGHVFCAECIHKWLRSHKTCPVCKQDVTITGLDDVD